MPYRFQLADPRLRIGFAFPVFVADYLVGLVEATMFLVIGVAVASFS